ncbi:MAG: hypothetical protein FWH03_00275 [Firmicutes bacterium]|nr:hypothetical protein [Bacillota bacterium]
MRIVATHAKKQCGKRFIAFLLALSVFLAVLLPACTILHVPVTDISFTQKADGIHMRIGDEINIGTQQVQVSPQLASNKNFTLESSNNAVVSPNYLNTIIALSIGEAELTVISADNPKLTDTITVTVDYAIPRRLEIVTEGHLIQEIDDFSEVQFWVVLAEQGDNKFSPNLSFDWTVRHNGTLLKTEAGQSLAYELLFTPDQQGLYQIGVSAQFDDGTRLEVFETLLVFEPFEVRPFTFAPSNALLQEEGAYRTVFFEADFEQLPLNPPPAIVWFVNDEPQPSQQASFSYRPERAGRHRIRLTINGKEVQGFAGDIDPIEAVLFDFVEIVAKGVSAPENVRFDFARSYPRLMLSWDSVSDDPRDVDYEIKIETVEGREIVRDYLVVGANQVDLRKFIGENEAGQLPQHHIFRTEFRISVRSRGGDIYLPSDYTEPIRTAMVPSEAMAHLKTTFYNGHRNFYAATPEDLADMFTYARLFRDRQFVEAGRDFPTYNFKTFIAFPFQPANAERMLAEAFSLHQATGNFGFTFKTEGGGRIFDITITFRTDGLPSRTTSGPAWYDSFNSNMPRVNYDRARVRDSLPIESADSGKLPVAVFTSEQLYKIAEQGYRPVPAAGSAAEKIYTDASLILRSIITDEMNDFEKALAIHDYIIWRVSYDFDAVGFAAEEAVQYTAYYLEGVFVPRAHGYFAVCDGMTKAFALLSNMENIPSMRVAGRGYDEINGRWNGHAWNKVRIEGRWYIVDTTWNNKALDLSAMFNIRPVREMLTRRYFLKTDAELSATHREETPNLYPRTAVEPVNVFQRITYQTQNFGTGNFFMDSRDAASAAVQAAALAEYMLETTDWAAQEQPAMPGGTPGFDFAHFISFEIMIHSRNRALYQNLTNHPVINALKIWGLEFNTHFFIVTDGNSNEMYQHIFIALNYSVLP